MPSCKEKIAGKEITSKMHIPTMELHPHLGLGEEERSVRQKVSLSFLFEFTRLPNACHTDEISETLCYHTLWSRFNEVIEAQEFRLIEHLAKTLLDITEQSINEMGLGTTKVSLDLHKVNVPLPAMPCGVHFSLAKVVG
jgi:7,8-dihydroneopterin aldolase/epimerase/oxygenase